MAKALFLLDFGVQALLLTLILVFGIFFFPLILMIPLGGWQLSSALIKGIAWRSRLYLTYFMAASAYCLALYAFAEEQITLPWAEEYWFSTASGLFFVIVLPLVGAITYCRWSYNDYIERKTSGVQLV